MIFFAPATPYQLWTGALLNTIGHAIVCAADPSLAYEHSWDGQNYSIQNSAGARGTITFAPDTMVGVFFDAASPRNPYRYPEQEYRLADMTAPLPPNIMALAKDEALQYVLDDYHGQVLAVVTSIFWSTGAQLVAAEPWELVMANGAHLIAPYLLPSPLAINVCVERFALSHSQQELLQTLFERRLTAHYYPVPFQPGEVTALLDQGQNGIEDTRDLLCAIGFADICQGR